VPEVHGDKKTIVKLNGDPIGYVIFEPKETWALYESSDDLQFDLEGRLYRIFAERDGVYLYRWSGKD